MAEPPADSRPQTLPDPPGAAPWPPTTPAHPAEAPASAAAPPTLPERYEVHGEIGRGGMGVVLRARDAELGREVAVKVLHDGASDVRRFLEEAQIGAQLQHPGVVPVYE